MAIVWNGRIYVAAPYFPGWVALSHQIPYQAGDVWTTPFLGGSMANPNSSTHLIRELHYGKTFENINGDFQYVAYRPVPKWIQITDLQTVMAKGDKVLRLSLGETNPQTQGVFVQAKIGKVFGQAIDPMRYTLWRKVADNVPAGPKKSIIPPPLPGNRHFSSPLPLP